MALRGSQRSADTSTTSSPEISPISSPSVDATKPESIYNVIRAKSVELTQKIEKPVERPPNIIIKITIDQSNWDEQTLDGETIKALELLEEKHIVKIYRMKED